MRKASGNILWNHAGNMRQADINSWHNTMKTMGRYYGLTAMDCDRKRILSLPDCTK